ncbi:MAG TPA: hypothetical protein VGB59_08845 [Allosphingosinicella sp.]
MKRLGLLAPAALMLISATAPSAPEGGKAPESELNSVVAAGPPHAMHQKKVEPRRAPGPVREAARRSYPPCSATVTDRCVQSGGRTYARNPVRKRSRGVQLAYRRAGERG